MTVKSSFFPLGGGKNLLVLLFFVASFSACKTYEQMELQVMKPASITIPADVKTMAFVDRNLTYERDSVYQYYKFVGDTRKDSVIYDSIVKKSSYLGFSENLPDFFQLDTIPFIQLAPTILSDSLRSFPRLSWTEVDSICALNNSDILVVLEGAQIKTDYGAAGEEGYWGTVDINYWTVWRVYDPLYQKVYDEYVAKDSLFMEVYANSYKRLVNEKLPSRKEVMQDVGYTMGADYVQRIAPAWAPVLRTYYCSGDKRLDAACYYLNQKKWSQAKTIWKAIAKDDSKEYKLAGKAAHNLALAYEVEGDLKEANQWIRKSIYFFKQLKKEPRELETSKIYALALMERINDESKLKEFFGE